MRSDIFFFVTTVMFVVLGIMFLWMLIYLVTIFKTIKEITNRAKQLFSATSDDIDEFRTNIKQKGMSWSNILGLFTKKKTSRKKKE